MAAVSVPKRKRQKRLSVEFRFVNDVETATKLVKSVAGSADSDTEVVCTIRNNRLADETIAHLIKEGFLETKENEDGEVMYAGNISVYPAVDEDHRQNNFGSRSVEVLRDSF